MAAGSTGYGADTYMTPQSLRNDENQAISESTALSINGKFPGHSVSAVRASSLEDSHIDHVKLAQLNMGSQLMSSCLAEPNPYEWRARSGQLPPHSHWPPSPSSSTFSVMEGHVSNSKFSQFDYAHPSMACSSQEYHLDLHMDQLHPQSNTQKDQLPCASSCHQSYPCFLPESTPQQTYEVYSSQYQTPTSSSSTTALAGCHVSEADCPKPDHRAAHVLTVLRSDQGSSQPCFIGGVTTICQQQICTKDDCPPDTQLRCPSEDVEAQRCPGNCAGRVCNGTGCPYNITCALAQTSHEYQRVTNNDLWPCGWPSNTMTCNVPIPRCPTAKPFDFNGDMASLHSQDHPSACNGVLLHKQQSELNNSLQHHIPNEFNCSLNRCCDLWGACEDDPCTYSDVCHDQLQWDQCLWDDCSWVPGNIENGERQTNIPSCQLGTVSAQSLTKSPSAVPSIASGINGGAKNLATRCLWVVDQSSGQLCGFSCDHVNDLQTHMERAHIDPQVARSESGQKRASSRVPKTLVCKWEGCKHYEQKKTFRQTQALKQHVITHSRCMCGLPSRDTICANVDIDKSAQCPECGQMCVDKTNLEIHMRTHTGEKPYECKYCDDHFAARSTLSEYESTRRSVLADLLS